MINPLEELDDLVKEWIRKQDAYGCGGCAFSDRESWEQPCVQCKRRARDFWRSKPVEEEKKGIYG